MLEILHMQFIGEKSGNTSSKPVIKTLEQRLCALSSLLLTWKGTCQLW